jgi:hypothetical protein
MFEPYKEAIAAIAPGWRAGVFPGVLLATLLTGCAGSKPDVPAVVDTPKPPVIANLIEKFQVDLGEGIKVDYQVEQKISKVNNKACFAFITGKLINLSGKALSRKTVLDVAVYSQGAMLYRDNTSPLADVQSGFNADFEMVTSPVFTNGCPHFDKINVQLRKVYL